MAFRTQSRHLIFPRSSRSVDLKLAPLGVNTKVPDDVSVLCFLLSTRASERPAILVLSCYNILTTPFRRVAAEEKNPVGATQGQAKGVVLGFAPARRFVDLPLSFFR